MKKRRESASKNTLGKVIEITGPTSSKNNLYAIIATGKQVAAVQVHEYKTLGIVVERISVGPSLQVSHE